MDSLFNLVTILVLLVHAGILVYALVRGQVQRLELRWLAAAIVLSAVAVLTYLLPPDVRLAGKIGRGFFLILALVGMTGAFGALIVEDMARGSVRHRFLNWWAVVVGVWVGTILLTALISPVFNAGQPDWLVQVLATPDVPTLIVIIGLMVSGVILMGGNFYLFYQADLPEVANRALYWVIETTVLLTGVILTGSGNDTLGAFGMVTLLTAMIGAATAFTRHRVFDIRGGVNQAAVLTLVMVFTASILFGLLYLVTGLSLHRTAEGLFIIAALAIGVTVLLIPVRQMLELLFTRLLNLPRPRPTLIMRDYSQQLAHVVELDELAHAASMNLNRVMGVKRSGLLLVNSTYNNELELLIIPGGSFGAESKGKTIRIQVDTPLYQTLARDHHAVSQFDLEFSPEFQSVTSTTRRALESLEMSAYAPIIMDNVMIGMLVAGQKNRQTPYFQDDLELLTTLAHQTGFALRNARLVADLQHLNATMRSLNRGLESANRELARLDGVKTDFITIASHELRTPLAQIRGYTDIIDTINEQGMLDQEQTNVLVTNLRKATERMEELISAMLDVSQIDVNAMDLRFAQTSMDTVLRLAIEPLTDAIKQRKQSLLVRGVKGLPPIEADLQRLVQAFRNVIVNAIKFTPDGGRIDITTSLQPAQGKDGVDHILVSITDTGVGIDSAHIELIFKKFYRTFDPQLHSTGTYKFLGAGPGLGLTIARGVIESHGGRIWAESPGHNLEKLPGATFYALVPTVPPQGVRKAISFDTNASKLAARGELTGSGRDDKNR